MKFEAVTSHKFSIRFTVGSLFIFATTVTALLGIGMQYYFSKQMAEENVLTRLSMTAAEVSSHIHQIDINATSTASILRSIVDYSQTTFSEQEVRSVFIEVLGDNPEFYSLYYANQDEDFYQIINLHPSLNIRDKIGATNDERWVVIKVNGAGDARLKRTSYYTQDLQQTRQTEEKSNFYPTRRPWFDKAPRNNVYKTDPYLFQHLKITGQSYSVRSKGSVIGVDMVLSSVIDKISSSEFGMMADSGVESFIFNNRGEVIASNVDIDTGLKMPDSIPLALTQRERQLIESKGTLVVSNQNDWAPYDFSQAGKPDGYAIDILRLIAQRTGIKLDFVNGFNSMELEEKYTKGEIDILQPIVGTHEVSGIKSVPIFKVEPAVASTVGNLMPQTLSDLSDFKLGVVAGFGMKEWVLERFPSANVVELTNLDAAKRALHKGEIEYLVDSYLTLREMENLAELTQAKVVKLKEPSIEFSFLMKQENKQMMDIINQVINEITPIQKAILAAKWFRSEQWRGSFIPYPQVYQYVTQDDKHRVMNEVQIKGQDKFLYITRLPSPRGTSDFFAVLVPGDMVTDAVTSRLLKAIAISAFAMAILLPAAWKFGSPIVRPILALREETKKIKLRKFDLLTPVNTRIKEVSELSDSISKMSDEIQQHEKQQEEFVESFIKLIAQAIDDKSPYTAGHCNRVPEIGLMLAEVAEQCQTGSLKDFHFKDDDERREFRIAAWLHDCGKITTPEHIVDKGTKLEANYNRIHEIRTRFEVLRRDAEIDYLKAIYEQKIDSQSALKVYAKRTHQLEMDFEFIANANVGGEFMGEDKIARIQQIANQTWVRHFDDGIGLSPIEEMNRQPNNHNLPVIEKLLDDKPEHIINRTREMEFDPKFGIKMKIPTHQYNLGEMYNLCISRGTLTEEDRFKINEHMISGIKMLEALPFPPELRRVPRYASTHHETLKGTGYPRKLTADDLSIPERILVIADIFEALTAADRPYKKAKPVSVAIDIMYKMALDDHLDMELFMLFLESGVYLQYAKSHMPEQQIDDVDIQKYKQNV